MTFIQCFFYHVCHQEKCICVCICWKKIVGGGGGKYKKELEIKKILNAFTQKEAQTRGKPKNSPQKQTHRWAST